MTSAKRWANPLLHCISASLFLVLAACSLTGVGSKEDGHPSYKKLIDEAESEYQYGTPIDAKPGDPATIGKYGAVTGVTIKVAPVVARTGPPRRREVVARFDVYGGDYPRLGMHRDANYVFVDHINERASANAAIMTNAYWIVPRSSSQVHYLIVDKRLDLAKHAYNGPVIFAADPMQAFVFGGCVEGSSCPYGHCSITDAGALY
jgi:hypothetical protein